MAIMQEKVKSNQTPATIFIGCGGIGSEIVSRVARKCHVEEKENIRFVILDTNANDLSTIKKLGPGLISIQTSSTQSVLDYLHNDTDAMENWFPNNAILYPKTVSEGAGQVRAISRLALNTTIKSGEIHKLYKAIDELFLKDGFELKHALRVVIVSSAAGGTGSGIAMIIGMLVRKYLQDHYREKSALIRGFLLLPGVMDSGVIKSQTERESLRRNGYATIKEINAFMMKASGFFEARPELNRFKDLHVDVPLSSGGVERLDSLPFDFCFLLDRVDNQLESMQTLDQYKEFAAQSLYEQNIGAMQKSSFSMEDNIIKEFANAQNLGRNRFGGIGASVLRYPYEDVADYVAYSRALDRIGGGAATADWSKYDKKYKKALLEFKKKRHETADEEPQRFDVYMVAMANDDTRFGMDMRRYLCTDKDMEVEVKGNVDAYISALDAEMLNYFTSLPGISEVQSKVNDLRIIRTYGSTASGSEDDAETGFDNLELLRKYESFVNQKARSAGKARAKAIFFDAPTIVSRKYQDYHVEHLLQTVDGAMHPNAVRYVLYMLYKELCESYAVSKSNVDKYNKELKKYASSADLPGYFDLDLPFSEEEEKCIDDVVALEKEDPTIWEKLGGYSKLYDAFNQHFPTYSKYILNYRDALLREAAYQIGMEYVKQLCTEFEKFYASFESKAAMLGRRKEDIVEELKYRKGQSVANVCATERHLNELLRKAPEGEDGLLLPDKLNAEIFDAIKKNAAFAREVALDPYLTDQSVDIFDDVLIDYFREAVRNDCAEVIDMNVVSAIAEEQRLNAYFELQDSVEEHEEITMPAINDADRAGYLTQKILYGNRLASPGFSGPKFDEPRLVSACAYSILLNDLKAIKLVDYFEREGISPAATDTVSKYELRFFNALYNLTPDQIARFMMPAKCKLEDFPTEKTPGIYYSAYHEYVQKIGPDSTKSTTISLHTDKRWDSVAVLPELNMDVQYNEMIRIHSALIYGLIHEMIKVRPSSRHDAEKRIYELENYEGELTPFVVSNGSECDEFYEVLDALYRDRAAVKEIHDIAADRRRFDIEKNHRYNETVFHSDVNSFRIGDGHKEPNSLFEIPLTYYNSLPRRLLDSNELATMIDSVIKVLETEISFFEQSFDRVPFLCKVLEEQFTLLVKNFSNDEYNEKYNIRKNSEVWDNVVLSMVLRKVTNVLKSAQVSHCDDRCRALRDMLRDTRD